MRLERARVGPYVRALASALNAGAPNSAYPPLLEGLSLLRALDPALSGPILLPAEVDERTGMPTWAWVERVRAELETGEAPDLRQIEQAQRLDPALAERMQGRRALIDHLHLHPSLSLRRVRARLQRRGPPHQVRIWSDRISPDGRWVRTAVVIRGAAAHLGCAEVLSSGAVRLDPGVEHLLARHAFSPLVALYAQISEVTIGDVVELSRGVVGPLWFPGIQLPSGLPPELGRGLLLHLPSETLSPEIRADADHDPLGEDRLRSPSGYGWARHRRFVASGRAHPAVQGWLEEIGALCEVIAL